ncbi:MAG TPA: baseplate J protein [Pseudomonas sp.]|nr:baseplate J/gp47 family protein [[Pseudomonas] sp. BICA1-14]HBW09159.1 baseplate J protein [Pseudomonas sp.]
MAFSIPDLNTTRQQIAADIEAHLPGTEARTRRSTLGVLAFALAGAVQGLHAHIDYRYRNFLPDELADAEGVERWARRFKLWYRAATSAGGLVTISGTPGSRLLTGTTLQFTQDQLYTVREDLALTASTGEVAVAAATAGSAGNLPAGARLTLVSPVAGIQSAATVGADGLTGGADQEDLAGLRDRLHRRMAEPPQGGTLADYETWALESHTAITRAWATEHEQGTGSVVVRVVCDNQDSPIPGAEVLEAADAYIGQRRPAGRRSVYYCHRWKCRFSTRSALCQTPCKCALLSRPNCATCIAARPHPAPPCCSVTSARRSAWPAARRTTRCSSRSPICCTAPARCRPSEASHGRDRR